MEVFIFTSHVGYQPEADKIAVLSPALPHTGPFRVTSQEELGKTVFEGEIKPFPSDWGRFGVADFTELKTPGRYQVEILKPRTRSVPFGIGEDIYIKTLRMAFEFFHFKRCGVAVPGYHPPCHLDDAVRRDDGTYTDTTGGWHDAGDVRKWTGNALRAMYGLLDFAERIKPEWSERNRDTGDILDELIWENDYLLKMIDPETGLIWCDTAGGVNGDNSDFRWTDNRITSGDERKINTAVVPSIQWQFIAVQALLSRLIKERDPSYAEKCLLAAERCLISLETGTVPSPRQVRTMITEAKAVRALCQLYKTTGSSVHLDSAHSRAGRLLTYQHTETVDETERIRGFFYADDKHETVFRSWSASGLPIDALVLLSLTDPESEHTSAYWDAVLMWVRDYCQPMSERTPFGIIPFGLYSRPPVNKARSRLLSDTFTFRWFTWDEVPPDHNPEETYPVFEHGGTSHLLSAAAGLAAAARLDPEGPAEKLAFRQLEWVMGCNPSGACLMTGGGINTPYPFSPFVGIIPGGILNGFVGKQEDMPYLNNSADLREWGSTEYWIPHNGHYIQTIGRLYEGKDLLL